MKRAEIIICSSILITLVIFFSVVSPALAQTCTDIDEDGYSIEGGICGQVDCDDDDNDVHPGAAEVCDGKDTDCDGWKSPSDVDIDNDGVAACAGDCNDNDPLSYPGAVELCDGKDNNCNYVTSKEEKDTDGDGYRICDASPDCDDNDSAVNPGISEICSDGKDNDCDSVIDETDCVKTAVDNAGPSGITACIDSLGNNCDGITGSAQPASISSCVDNDADGYGAHGDASCEQGTSVDCDDSDANVHPGAPEICDGKDSDCDGWKPPSDVDKDNDGVALCAGDCNDRDSDVKPGADEICGDGIDNNCNRVADEAGCSCPDGDGDGAAAAYCGGTDLCDSDNSTQGLCAGCTDADGDGIAAENEGIDCGLVDCDDTDPNVKPGAAELCDGRDTNCDGWKPPTDVDNDNDGFPLCANDCNDSDPGVYPGADELCDGIDNDCNYVLPLNERDRDNDGFLACGSDCNDLDPAVHSGLEEFCGDKKDNNCNGQIDEAECICPDLDGDGFTASYCGGTDCNDSRASSFPGAVEECNDGIDNDCDGLIDIKDPDAVNCPTCTDNDNDDYYIEGGGCGPVDCDDTDPAVHPNTAEICDGKDTDCDGWKPNSDKDDDGDGVAVCAGDCDDSNPERFPGNIEHPLRNTCDDGIDNDCNSLADEADPRCKPATCKTKTSPKNVPHFFTLLNADGTVHPDNGRLNCEKCHAPDYKDPIRFACQRCHADAADTSNLLNGILKEQYPLDVPYGFGSAPNVAMHSSETVGTKYGGWTMGAKGCVVCHNPHAQEQDNLFGTDYGMYIKENICFDNEVTGQRIENLVEITAGFGEGSFADGPPHSENICETCHTRTNHHQSDGTAPGGQSHFDGVKCTTCHLHDDGFKPSGNCLVCHNQSPPPGSNDPDRRQVVEGTAGDGGGDFINASHHVTDGSSEQVVDADSCEVCHDLALHTIFGDGVSVLLYDQDGEESHIYDGTGGSVEGFCVSCHDNDGSLVNGAEPFITAGDINNPPDIGWTIGDVSHSIDDACFNCHGDSSGINAHGSDSEFILRYNNYISGAAQAFCYNCHNGTVAATDIEELFSRAVIHGVEDCQACHNQHTAEPGTHTPDGQWYPTSPDENTNNVSGVLTGIYGVEPTLWPTAWGTTSKSNFTVLDSAEKEYQVCFKCHAKYSHIYSSDCTLCHFKPDGSIYKFRSGVREFNPNNQSAHPVVVPTSSQTGSYSPGPLVPEQMTPPWTNTGNQTMYCADCHGADNEDTVDHRGPHGSEKTSMLKGVGQYWPTGPDGATVWRLNTVDAANPDLFCKNCHPIYSDGEWQNNVHASTNHNNLQYAIGDESGLGIPCISCHYIVPHGGRRSRLIAYNSTNVKEYVNIVRVNTNEITGAEEYVRVPFNAIKGFKKEERFDYQIASCFTREGLGCHLPGNNGNGQWSHEQDGGELVGGYDE